MMKSIQGRNYFLQHSLFLSACSGVFFCQALIGSALENWLQPEFKKEIALAAFFSSLPIAIGGDTQLPIIRIVFDYYCPTVEKKINTLHNIFYISSGLVCNPDGSYDEHAETIDIAYSISKHIPNAFWDFIYSGNLFRTSVHHYQACVPFKKSDVKEARDALQERRNFTFKSLDERYTYTLVARRLFFNSPYIEIVQHMPVFKNEADAKNKKG